MSNPVISVVMSVFNGEQFLAEAIESILGQSFEDFEFIIVNDGSTDKSTSLLAAYQKKDHRIRVCDQANAGLIAALNRGCALARGKYIARMDADDISVRERLGLQFAFMEAHPQTGVVGGAVQFIASNGRPLTVVRYPASNANIQQELLDRCVLWHPTVVIRRTVFESVGGYRNVPDSEDYDLWLRIADRFALANLPTVLLKYRLHPGQVSATRARKQALGSLACRSAAVVRRSGTTDPLDGVTDITPDLLRQMSLSEVQQQTAVARGYLSCLRSMYSSGNYPGARKMIEGLLSPECALAAKWTIADTHLYAAKLHLRNRNIAASARSAVRAIFVRPAILGRPAKRIMSLARQAN